FCFCAPVGQGRKSTCWNPGGLPPGVRPALFFRGLFRLGLAAPLGGGLLFSLFGLFRLGLLGGGAFFHLGLGGPAGRGGLFLTGGLAGGGLFGGGLGLCLVRGGLDRKSTRLNSSHVSISYAVFCLKKKIKSTFQEE